MLLLCDEVVHGHKMTKFVGGGLEFGEGTIDCLKREFIEETEKRVEVLEHFYTTDFFQASAFNSEQQLISIYYKVKFLEEENYPISNEASFENDIQFRWIKLSDLTENDLTFPVDKVVLKKLKK